MKKVTMAVLALSLCMVTIQCGDQKSSDNQTTVKQDNDDDPGLTLSYMDKSVRPQDDFYNFVNGGWMKTAKIPSDRSRWGSFGELREATEQQDLTILNEVLEKKYDKGTDGHRIKAAYSTFVDWKTRDAQGITPIKDELASIDAIKSVKDLTEYLKKATRQGDNPLYDWGVSADLKDSKMNAVYLGGPSLGLGRDYYQKDSESNRKTLERYQEYVATLMGVIGDKQAKESAKEILDFEKKLAGVLLTNVERRDATKRYNPQTMAQLKNLVSNVDLPSYLQAVGVNTDQAIIGELEYYKKLDSFINEANLPLLKKYLKYNVIASNAGNLTKKLDEIQFDFYRKYLRGQKEQQSLEKRGLSFVNRVVGEAFGKLYVEKYFPPEAKKEMLTLIDYIKKAFHNRIENLTWMSPETKKKALDKLSKFTVKVAYPDKWRDYSKLHLKTAEEGGTLYDNLQAITQWHYQKQLDKIGKPVEKWKWHMTPQTVNAYYNPSNNEIVFPAAILQPPFFNFKADPAINFGGIGAVIGHEISHGFDDSGSRFDGDGNLNNWWTDQDRKKFEEATTKLADQYSQYEVAPGIHVNGKFTLGENIGDLGGANVAYQALQMYLKDHDNPGEISGFTQDQRFFISWATVWRTLSTEKTKINQVKTDPHSPGYFRSFGPLVNMDAFYKAFDIKPGDKLYKKPEDRIKIW